jgi:hypothetical protein
LGTAGRWFEQLPRPTISTSFSHNSRLLLPNFGDVEAHGKQFVIDRPDGDAAKEYCQAMLIA